MSPKRPKSELSDRQKSILHFIEKRIARKMPPPSIREICEGCDISSTSVVDYNLKRMEALGYIDRTGKVSRGIQVLRPIGALREDELKVNVPLYGRIAAGTPIQMPEGDRTPDDHLEVARDLLRAPVGQSLFALRVDGTSMVDALVDDGDVVILAAQETAERGEMVAAWIQSRDEWTLKKYYPKGDGTVELRPANRASFTEKDIREKFTFPATDVQISGRVCLVLRQL